MNTYDQLLRNRLAGGNYEAEIKVKKFQTLPKKWLRGMRISLGRGYVKVSAYVIDEPYSKIPPKPVITLATGGRYIRIVFDSLSDYIAFCEQFEAFRIDCLPELGKAYQEAKTEWEEAHDKIPSLKNRIDSNLVEKK